MTIGLIFCAFVGLMYWCANDPEGRIEGHRIDKRHKKG